LTNPLFLSIISKVDLTLMNREKLKLIVRNLESLVECLKTEIDSDIKNPQYEEIKNFLNDYDEVFYDDDAN
jgi:hypothetical protein